MYYFDDLKKNINRNYIFTILQNLDLTRGIWMIYLAHKGMSLTQLGLLETIFHLTSFGMEVPTGAVADIFGRKVSRIYGRIFSLISILLLYYADSFEFFAISFIFSALSYNLESGAGDALIYDSLKEIDQENEFMKVSGRKELFFQISSTAAFLVGGYLAYRSYEIAFIFTIILSVITIIQSLSFKEPSIGVADKDESKKNIFLEQLRSSVLVVKNNTRIAFLIIVTQMLLSFCTCTFYYLQNLMKSDGYNEAMIGLIYAVSSVGAAIISPFVHFIEKKIKEKGILIYVPFITVGCMWGVAVSKFHYLFFIVMTISESILFIAAGDYINKMIPSKNRATVLSFASMVFSLCMIILFPVVGYLGDIYSLRFSLKILSMTGLIAVIISSVRLKTE